MPEPSAPPAGGTPGRAGVLQLVTSTDRRGAEVAAAQLGEALTAGGLATDTLRPVARYRRRAPRPAHASGAAAGTQPRSPALARRARQSAVVVGQGSSTLPFGAAASTLARTPFVYRSIGDPAYWATTRARQARVRTALGRARLVVAIWPGAADSLMRLYGLPSARVEVIPNGVPADAFSPTPRRRTGPAARARLAAAVGAPIEPDRPLVAYLGALSAEKDPLLAIDAMDECPRPSSSWPAAGPLAGVVMARSRQLDPARVHVIGAVADPASLLAAADALVVPSRSEGIPAVAIEAGLAGLPVVATDVGGIAEVVVDGETGRVVSERRRRRALAAALGEVLDGRVGDDDGRTTRGLAASTGSRSTSWSPPGCGC